jgi:hypothetical protein
MFPNLVGWRRWHPQGVDGFEGGRECIGRVGAEAWGVESMSIVYTAM